MNRLKYSIWFLVSAVAILLILTQVQAKHSAFGGLLVFTDFPRPHRYFSVEQYDLDQNIRTALPRQIYHDTGTLFPVDAERIFVSICLGTINNWFCTGVVRAIVSPRQLDSIESIRLVWQDNFGSPVWSPDGTRIAFVQFDNTASELAGDVYVMNADGTGILDLTLDVDHNGFSLTWSPDSQQIAFACQEESSICIANADGSSLQSIIAPANYRVREMAWSPVVSQIVVSLLSRDHENAELFLIDPVGLGLRRLLEAGSNFQEDPVWSPDGSKIAFRSGEEGYNKGEIYVIDPDGSNLINVSQRLEGNEFAQTWSPDSTKLAFFSNHHTDGMFLYVTNADGSGLQRLTENSTWELTDVGSPQLFWIP